MLFLILTVPLELDDEYFKVCSVKAFLTSNDICCESFKLQMIEVFNKLNHFKEIDFQYRCLFFSLPYFP